MPLYLRMAVGGVIRIVEPFRIARGGTGLIEGDQLSADREISCPSARKSVSAYREIGMSAVIVGTQMAASRPDRAS